MPPISCLVWLKEGILIEVVIVQVQLVKRWKSVSWLKIKSPAEVIGGDTPVRLLESALQYFEAS